MLNDYLIQQWVFDVAGGGYDFDLAMSHVEPPRVRDLRIDPDWDLDYIDARGLEELRTAVSGLYGPGIGAGNVLVANGTQEALYLFYRTFLEPGCHVLVAVPGWQQAWEVPREVGAKVTTFTWTPGAPLDPAVLEEALTPETRLINLISPGNPSGRAISPGEWDVLVDAAERRSAWLLVDEEFEVELANSVVHRYSRAVSVSGLSKIHGMPGLRVGWAVAGSAEGVQLLERMLNYKRYLSICNSALSERLAVAALGERTWYVRRYREFLREGRDSLDAFGARNRDWLDVVPPDNTPFAWVALPETQSSWDFARQLLEEHRVVVMPGEVFGIEHGFRLSYARPRAELDGGLERIEDLGRKLRATSQ